MNEISTDQASQDYYEGTTFMSKPHKHAEVIKAWADGASIQLLSSNNKWVDVINPEWLEDIEYRVKPEPFAFLESQDFYEVCQEYRHAKDCDKHSISPSGAFENLKDFIRMKLELMNDRPR